MTYKVTTKVLDLFQQLLDEGYQGDAALTNDYATGAKETLGNSMSLKLNGFSKETLHIVEDTDTGSIVFVGRYNKEGVFTDPTVSDIVDVAYSFYQYYKDRGYSMPHEFVELFKKYGHIKEKTVTSTVYEET